MVKKSKLTLTIDENILKQAKETIPNISRVVEDTLKTMLETKDSDEFKIKIQIKAEEEQISRSENRINILHNQLNMITDFKYGKSEDKEKAWRQAFNNFRSQKIIPDEILKHAVVTLGIKEEDLMELIEDVDMDAQCKQVKAVEAQEWSFIEENYLKVVE
ncbi:MAG: type II toxin-antitoxin system CcdA family antitoxin [Methanobacterium sp.]